MRNVLQEIADEQQAALRARIAELEADLKTQQAALKEAVGYFNAEKERSERLEKALREASDFDGAMTYEEMHRL